MSIFCTCFTAGSDEQAAAAIAGVDSAQDDGEADPEQRLFCPVSV